MVIMDLVTIRSMEKSVRHKLHAILPNLKLGYKIYQSGNEEFTHCYSIFITYDLPDGQDSKVVKKYEWLSNQDFVDDKRVDILEEILMDKDIKMLNPKVK